MIDFTGVTDNSRSGNKIPDGTSVLRAQLQELALSSPRNYVPGGESLGKITANIQAAMLLDPFTGVTLAQAGHILHIQAETAGKLMETAHCEPAAAIYRDEATRCTMWFNEIITAVQRLAPARLEWFVHIQRTAVIPGAMDPGAWTRGENTALIKRLLKFAGIPEYLHHITVLGTDDLSFRVDNREEGMRVAGLLNEALGIASPMYRTSYNANFHAQVSGPWLTNEDGHSAMMDDDTEDFNEVHRVYEPAPPHNFPELPTPWQLAFEGVGEEPEDAEPTHEPFVEEAPVFDFPGTNN